MDNNSNKIGLSIIVPCFNEEGNVRSLVLQVVSLLNKNAVKGEIVLIDDGSSDNTKDEIESLIREFCNVVGVKHKRNLGIVESWHSGLNASQGSYVLTIDADMQYNPNDIILLYSEINKGNCDLVQGWRKEYRGGSIFRLFLSRILSLFLNILFLSRLPDIKSGFVIYKRAVFTGVLTYKRGYRAFQHFFILAALKNGYSLKRVPITFYPRTQGKSSIKNPFLFSLKVLTDIPRAIFEFGLLARQRHTETETMKCVE